MTGDKFRARADGYIKAARAVTDPVHKLALVDVAQRWLRLAAQIDGAATRNPRKRKAPNAIAHEKASDNQSGHRLAHDAGPPPVGAAGCAE
jgi:hypothetical protein